MGPIPGPGLSKDIELGNCTQVDAEEIEVDAFQSGLGNAGDGCTQLLSVGGDQTGCGDLMVVLVAGELLGCQALQGLDDQLGVLQGLGEDVVDGLTDDGEQGDQDQQGDECPQAAAHAHGRAFFTLQSLNFFILLLLVVGVLLLDLLDTGLQTGHLHHALLGLGIDGSQDSLNDEGENDHGKAIVGSQVIQETQQPTEGNSDQITQLKCKKHFSFTSLRYGIVSVGVVEGIAAQDAPQGQKPSLQGAIFFNGFVGVGGTGGLKPAHGWIGRGNVALVKANQSEEQFFHWRNLKRSVSLRTSAHTGVAIPTRFQAGRMVEGDSHASLRTGSE